MNSEELEQSLRTEFESYLKNVLADMRQDVAEFQKQFEAEFEKHKAQIDEVFQSFSSRIAAEREIDASFSESVVEHLRLSRDEGARITAMAIAEAEEMEKQNLPEPVEAPQPHFSFGEIRDAINDISTKTTQSAILKTLVQHAAQFTPRGAFFIIKNEHFVGWRVFGKNGETVDEHTVREVFLPVASSTVLGESVRSLAAVESTYGTYDDDSIYLNKLEFGHPDKMYAVPLIVRGRSVAVLYADNDDSAEEINIEALETLVRVASLTVEILASSRTAQPQAEESTTAAASYERDEESAQTPSFEGQTTQEAEFEQAAPETDDQPETEAPATQYAFAEQPAEYSDQTPAAAQEAVEESSNESTEETYSYETSTEQEFSSQPIDQPAESFETADYQTSYEGDSFSFKPTPEVKLTSSEYVAEAFQKDEEASVQAEAAEVEAADFEKDSGWNKPVEIDDYYSKESSVSFEKPSYEPTSSSYEFAESPVYETETAVAEAETEYASEISGKSDYQFEPGQSYETPSYETPSYETPQYEAENFTPSNGVSYDSGIAQTGASEMYAPVETSAAGSESPVKQPSKSRFSERNVDLPIEVSEDERRLHNDARRFARLLVSEIKLYNEQKVKEGREGSDLYERLREAIDRSREMYDKRVQPPVAAKFDYFHYELVSSLAEGDAAKLGASYPGANT